MKNLTQEALKPGLGFSQAFSLVIGTVIGTGVFLKAAVMLQEVGSAGWVLMAWLAAGLLSLAGALCFAELGSRIPDAGGEYAYLREAFGERLAYLNGWMLFSIGNPGSVAAYSVGLMTFLRGLIHFSDFTLTLSACGVILLFTLINCATVRAAGWVHTALAALKILLILAFMLALLARGQHHEVTTFALHDWPGWRAFGAAMLAALWAYDGWNGMPMAASEVLNPRKTIPRALIFGMLGVTAIYMLMNVGFFTTLTNESIRGSYSPMTPEALPVATQAAQVAMGPSFVALISILLAFSAMVSLNGSILTGARVAFAMARDGLFFKSLGSVHHRTKSPVVSVLTQGAIAIAMACSGTFDQLTDYVMFASWIFYALSIAALFKLRQRSPRPDTFQTPLYPWVPAIFLIVSVWLLINTLITEPKESLIGLLLIAAGLLVRLFLRPR